MKPALVVFAIFAATVSGAAGAQSENLSMVSAVSVAPASIVAEAAFEAAREGTRWVVKGVAHTATGASVALEAVGSGVVVSVDVTVEAADRLAHAVGDSLAIVAASTGYSLLLGAEVVAFVPNELGRALIHHRELAR
jgi:hypothetical protein